MNIIVLTERRRTMSKLINADKVIDHLNQCLAESNGETPITDSVLLAIKHYIQAAPEVKFSEPNNCVCGTDWSGRVYVGICPNCGQGVILRREKDE